MTTKPKTIAAAPAPPQRQRPAPPRRERTSFTIEIDRRILEGYLGDKERMFEELGRVGITAAAIVKRGKVLGLWTNALAKCRAHRLPVAIRRCLMCEQSFLSVGPQNRMCSRCRRKG
jgi:hypothetical protein